VRNKRLDELPPALRERFAAGRVWAAHQAPYLASALLALDPVVVELDDDDDAVVVDLSAFPTDRRWHVYVDPEVLATTEVPEIGFWLLHQVGHLLREHAKRFPERVTDLDVQPLGGRTPAQRRWNLSSDVELNDDLSTEDLVLPRRGATADGLGLLPDLVAEEYWDRLDPSHADTRESIKRACDCGSGCDGQERPWDCAGGLTRTAIARICRDTARRIRDHVRRRGTVPGRWARWADEILEPTVDWRRELASQIRRGAADVAGRVDYTYRRPSRRQAAMPNVVLPSLRQPLPRVAVVIDTSGSMSDGMLGQALGEVGGVLRSLGIGRKHLRIVCCDAEAYEAQSVRELGQVELPGGGGTDMRRGVEAATELRPQPQLVVVLTDGFTPWPPAPPPGVRVVVGLMDDQGETPDWADTVLVGGAGR
jgi:predicted metal-dependent peptidase